MAGLMIQNYCPQIFKDLHRLFVTQNGRLMMQYCCPQIFTDLHRLFVTQNGRSNDAILWPTDFHRFQRLKIEDWRLRAYHNSQLSPLSYQSFVAHRFSQIYTNIIIVNSVTYKSDTNRFSHC